MLSHLIRVIWIGMAIFATALPMSAQETVKTDTPEIAKKLSFIVIERPIAQLLAQLAKESGATILVESTITSKVTMEKKDVSLLDALDALCKSLNLACWRVGFSQEELTRQKITADDLAKAIRALSALDPKLRRLVIADGKETQLTQLAQTAKREVAEWQPEKIFPALANTYLICQRDVRSGLDANMPPDFDVNAFLASPPNQREAALTPLSPQQRQAVIGSAIRQSIMQFQQLPPDERRDALRGGFSSMMINLPPDQRMPVLQTTLGVMSQLEPEVFSDVIRSFMPMFGGGGPPPPPSPP